MKKTSKYFHTKRILIWHVRKYSHTEGLRLIVLTRTEYTRSFFSILRSASQRASKQGSVQFNLLDVHYPFKEHVNEFKGRSRRGRSGECEKKVKRKIDSVLISSFPAKDNSIGSEIGRRLECLLTQDVSIHRDEVSEAFRCPINFQLGSRLREEIFRTRLAIWSRSGNLWLLNISHLSGCT